MQVLHRALNTANESERSDRELVTESMFSNISRSAQGQKGKEKKNRKIKTSIVNNCKSGKTSSFAFIQNLYR